jgi:hypothetical protein
MGRSRRAQDELRELGGIPLVLNHCTSDSGSAFVREWALLAVRNLCADNLENQVGCLGRWGGRGRRRGRAVGRIADRVLCHTWARAWLCACGGFLRTSPMCRTWPEPCVRCRLGVLLTFSFSPDVIRRQSRRSSRRSRWRPPRSAAWGSTQSCTGPRAPSPTSQSRGAPLPTTRGVRPRGRGPTVHNLVMSSRPAKFLRINHVCGGAHKLRFCPL